MLVARSFLSVLDADLVRHVGLVTHISMRRPVREEGTAPSRVAAGPQGPERTN